MEQVNVMHKMDIAAVVSTEYHSTNQLLHIVFLLLDPEK